MWSISQGSIRVGSLHPGLYCSSPLATGTLGFPRPNTSSVAVGPDRLRIAKIENHRHRQKALPPPRLRNAATPPQAGGELDPTQSLSLPALTRTGSQEPSRARTRSVLASQEPPVLRRKGTQS